jgi:NitT/TauT family transport system permease protein/putative hydroxymethylpyrimidine transport system permease protein
MTVETTDAAVPGRCEGERVPVPPPAPAGGGVRALVARAASWLAPGLLIVAFIGAWQVSVSRGLIQSFILPAPSTIVRAIVEHRGEFAEHTLRTATEAVLAFVLGSCAAVLVAMIFVQSRLVERSVYPLTLAAQAIPVVAMAPLLSIWLGPGMASKVAVAGFLVYFPTLVNMQRGLRSVDREIEDVARAFNMGRWRTLMTIRLPSSLPYLFVALKIGAGGCFLGALTAEWIGSDEGLGYLVTIFGAQFQIAELWGAAIIASLLAVAMFGLVSLAEYLLLPWHRQSRSR